MREVDGPRLAPHLEAEGLQLGRQLLGLGPLALRGRGDDGGVDPLAGEGECSVLCAVRRRVKFAPGEAVEGRHVMVRPEHLPGRADHAVVEERVDPLPHDLPCPCDLEDSAGRPLADQDVITGEPLSARDVPAEERLRQISDHGPSASVVPTGDWRRIARDLSPLWLRRDQPATTT